jgi:hypothetical protein
VGFQQETRKLSQVYHDKYRKFILNILKLLMILLIKKEKISILAKLVANGNFVGTKSITDTNYN